MNDTVKNKWYTIFSPICGLACGAEILTDEDGRWSYGIQLFILRIYITRDISFLEK
jgi:hypothetical protein